MAIKCIDPTIDDWLNTIPPLGTLNEDGVPTEEDTAAATIAGTYLQSQAVLGGFELMYGKNTFSVNADENSTDNMDITYGSDAEREFPLGWSSLGQLGLCRWIKSILSQKGV